MTQSQTDKDRLENNQRMRRNICKQQLGSSVNISNEQTWYCPKFFTKEVDSNGEYLYRANHAYWKLREKLDWTNQPRIFEDNCQAFY